MATKKLKPRKPVPADRPLTDKQEAWCRWMASAEVNFNGVEAARKSGYKGNDAALSRISYENRRKPNVAARLKQLTDKALSGADVTVEAVLRRVSVIGEKALIAGQYAPAARCAELHGKYLKMWTERIEHVQTLEDISTEELVRLFNEIVEAGGLDLAQLFKGHEPASGGVLDSPGNTTTH